MVAAAPRANHAGGAGAGAAGRALERLPLIAGETDPDWRVVTAFLVGYPPHSSRAYFSDLKAWYA